MFGTANDYVTGPYNIRVPAGLTNVSYDILINNDNLLEDDENFYLFINPSLLPSGVAVSYDNQVMVTIINDDGKSNF